MKYKNLSIEQRIHNALGAQTVEEYKARHAYLHGVCYSREEWDYMWLKSPNTTWAHQFGRMVGWDEVYMNSVEHMDRLAVMGSLDSMVAYPVLMGHDLRSVTCSGCHVLSSDVIEVAEDGQSARSSYLTPGTLMGSVGMDGKGRGGVWLWERYGSDFVYCDGKWQWFHEQVCPDLAGAYDDQNWAHDRYLDYLDKDISIGEVGGNPAQLSEPGLFHADNSITQVVQNTVPAPRPYKTLDDENTYSPGRNDPTGKITVEAKPVIQG
ncbi:MAG: nuclear transport factor 2 family protein, partial [Oscillospiraceae bacterium]|nr:nuclear transport factor 2 family protein [Oscillospiraceae bacterium]